MRDLGQPCLFQVRSEQQALDAMLSARGYEIVDPCVIYGCPIGQLAPQGGDAHVLTHWPPTQVQRDIWRAGNIHEDWVAIMERSPKPKTSVLSTYGQAPAGTAYLGTHENLAILHALEVLARYRRNRLGRHMVYAAADWGRLRGVTWLYAITTRENIPANRLYAAMGMRIVSGYHYRRLDERITK